MRVVIDRGVETCDARIVSTLDLQGALEEGHVQAIHAPADACVDYDA